jgi:hypothetical protein
MSQVVIRGAGIAGCALALLLGREGHNVMVVERASAPRSGGQAVDVRGAAFKVAEQMGLVDDIRARRNRMVLQDWWIGFRAPDRGALIYPTRDNSEFRVALYFATRDAPSRCPRCGQLSGALHPYRVQLGNACLGSRAVVGGHCEQCRRRAESAPTVVYSGRTGVRAKAAISLPARNRLHRPTR